MFGTERNEFNNKTRCYQFNSKTRQRPLNHWQLETINRSIITLLNVDYTILALIYVTRLKSGLSNIIAESQTGFMAKRHICSNIRLVLDVLDYNHFVHSDALILFLDFYKAFDTIDHHFLLQSLHTFGFGNNFIQTVKMFYRGINSSVILQNNTSRRFFINRGVRQGCPISPFLFLIVVELLAISVEKNPNLLGITLFNREIKISQLADDTTLFLKHKNLIKNAIKLVQTFFRCLRSPVKYYKVWNSSSAWFFWTNYV